jgi:hypothetical protein
MNEPFRESVVQAGQFLFTPWELLEGMTVAEESLGLPLIEQALFADKDTAVYFLCRAGDEQYRENSLYSLQTLAEE